MNANTVTADTKCSLSVTERLDFSSTEREHLVSAFSSAFQKLKQSIPSKETSENHFDEEFHKQLMINGLHLQD